MTDDERYEYLTWLSFELVKMDVPNREKLLEKRRQEYFENKFNIIEEKTCKYSSKSRLR